MLSIIITIETLCRWDYQTWSIYYSWTVCMPIEWPYLGLFICNVCISYIVVKSRRHFFEYLLQFWSSQCKAVQNIIIELWAWMPLIWSGCFLNMQCQIEKLYMWLLSGIWVWKQLRVLGSYLNASFNPKVSLCLLTILSSLPL
jgi:hypothetical protein